MFFSGCGRRKSSLIKARNGSAYEYRTTFRVSNLPEQCQVVAEGWGCLSCLSNKAFLCLAKRDFFSNTCIWKNMTLSFCSLKITPLKAPAIYCNKCLSLSQQLVFFPSFVHFFYWNDTLWGFIFVVSHVYSSPQLQALLAILSVRVVMTRLKSKAKQIHNSYLY